MDGSVIRKCHPWMENFHPWMTSTDVDDYDGHVRYQSVMDQRKLYSLDGQTDVKVEIVMLMYIKKNTIMFLTILNVIEGMCCVGYFQVENHFYRLFFPCLYVHDLGRYV